MRALTDTELTRMQDTQEDAMLDTCSILTHVETNVSGELQSSWTESGNRSPCGIRIKKSREIHRSDLSIVRTDAQLRLPINTAVNPTDRIKIITRFGQPVESLIYGIEGEVLRGPSGLLLDLVIIEPGINR